MIVEVAPANLSGDVALAPINSGHFTAAQTEARVAQLLV